ncbi:hypothetical protein [Candidatus Methylomirabilis sp.]
MKEVQESRICETETKKLYAKPTLAKHKALRDITAGPVISRTGD